MLANWEAKAQYMLHEIIKYQNYCDVLEKSIAEKQQEQQHLEEGQEDNSNDSV